jgi:NADP-dependent 3-hydroxy acid dehydrogenase YdfG
MASANKQADAPTVIVTGASSGIGQATAAHLPTAVYTAGMRQRFG